LFSNETWGILFGISKEEKKKVVLDGRFEVGSPGF
jgi:hypothetical protein